MLMAPNGDDESHSGADATLSPDAVDAINKAKAAVEALPGCAGKVSCADILAMAARDVVSLVTFFSRSRSHRHSCILLPISPHCVLPLSMSGACPPACRRRARRRQRPRPGTHGPTPKHSPCWSGQVGSVHPRVALHLDPQLGWAGTVPSLRASDFFDGRWRTTPRPGGPAQRGAPPRFGRIAQSRAGMCGVSAAGPRSGCPRTGGHLSTSRRRGAATRAAAVPAARRARAAAPLGARGS